MPSFLELENENKTQIKMFDDYKEKTIRHIDVNEILVNRKPLKISGFGFFRQMVSNDEYSGYLAYLMLHIDGFVFAIKSKSKEAPVINTKTIFCEYQLYNQEVFKNHSFFSNTMPDGYNFYHNFETELEIDIKYYEYSNETKLIISKCGDTNINMYFSVLINKNDPKEITLKINKGIFDDVKHKKMLDLLNSRVNKITSSKSK